MSNGRMSRYLALNLFLALVTYGVVCLPALIAAEPESGTPIQTVTSGCIVYSPNEFGFSTSLLIRPGEVVRYRFLRPSGSQHPALLWLPGDQAPRRVDNLIIDPPCEIAVP
jgi:hypothetical protein